MQNLFLKDVAKIWPCSVSQSESGEGLGPIKNEDEDLPSAESHAELVRTTHEWISAVTERSDLSDNLVSLFMVRNLFTIDYYSGWQYLWISSVFIFWLEFHM